MFSREARMTSCTSNELPTPDTLCQALCAVIDPEAGMNIVDLGLIYDVAVADAAVQVRMTMTSPACPMGEMIVDEVRATLAAVVPAGWGIDVALVWEPPWAPAMMSETARRHFEW